MRFFVASRGIDGSAALGGLAGADRHCQSLAQAVGAGDRTWRAYLSTAPQGDTAGVDARDRIGQGPWHNAHGDLIARDLEELHGDRNGLTIRTALTERGEIPDGFHDVLTGSTEDGRLAWVDGTPATCGNWTTTQGVARIGHTDRMDSESFYNPRFKRWYGSWNSEHDTPGCTADALASAGGAGSVYCFAVDPAPPVAKPSTPPHAFTYARGLNVNHWLGDNLPAEVFPRGGYAGTWFDEDDVAWIAAQGFDHVRIWVAGDRWIAPTGELDETALAPFDRALAWADAHGLGVVLSMHGLPGYRAGVRGEPEPADAASPFTDEATRADAAYLWWLVARRYAEVGDGLRFELLNSPTADDAAQMQAFNREALAAVRRVDRARVVYLAPHDHGIDSVGEVDLADPRTAVAVTFFEPEVFTLQFDPRTPRVEFPGAGPDTDAHGDTFGWGRRWAGKPLTDETVERRIDELARRASSLPASTIYVAGFGVFEAADDDSTRRYLSVTRAAFERHGFGWAVYDYHSGCAVRAELGDGDPTRVLHALALRP